MAHQQPDGAAAQLRVALDNMPGALVYTDDDLKIVFCNDRFKEMYIVPQELLQPGRPYADLPRDFAGRPPTARSSSRRAFTRSSKPASRRCR